MVEREGFEADDRALEGDRLDPEGYAAICLGDATRPDAGTLRVCSPPARERRRTSDARMRRRASTRCAPSRASADFRGEGRTQGTSAGQSAVAELEAELDRRPTRRGRRRPCSGSPSWPVGAEEMDDFYRGIHEILGGLINAENIYIAL